MSRKRKKKSGKIEIIMLWPSVMLSYLQAPTVQYSTLSTVQTARKESRINKDISIYFIC